MEDFFSSYANSAMETAGWEYDSLLEVFQGVQQGFYLEILRINDGAYFVVVVSEHSSNEWNVMQEHPSSLIDMGSGNTHYRFETREGAAKCLADFVLASLSKESE